MAEINIEVMNELADELKAVLVEAEFQSRWMLVEAYHKAGEIIQKAYEGQSDDAPLTKETLVQALAGMIGKSERTLWYSVKFYEQFPSLDALPEGKNVNWNKVVTKYLTSPKEECSHNGEKMEIVVEVCKDCDKQLRKVIKNN